MGNFEQDFRFEDGILRVRLSGEFPMNLLDSNTNLFQPLAYACAAHSCQKAIVDAREPKVVGLFRAGEGISNMTRSGFRIAFVPREDMIDSFFDKVAEHNPSAKAR